MSGYSIQAEGLGKRYQLGEWQRYKALRDTLTDALYAPFRSIKTRLIGGDSRSGARRGGTIWALKDISFEIPQGAVVGIIGNNGAGKSTLLKVLSRITEPTEGRAEIRGRVGTLLEVGTGFHPELTGRDNVFLNGAILGMRRREIERKFDEIVEFAGLERFVDTPVKRYSTGMYIRLAFAVAAHLEPEVLLVDEVLSVGDAAFQKKCLGKLDDVATQGRTVLFISHNLSSIQELCPTSLWLDEGRLRASGPSQQVIEQYLATVNRSDLPGEVLFQDDGTKAFQVRSVQLVDSAGSVGQTFEVTEPPVIEIRCIVREPIHALFGHLTLSRSEGAIVYEGDSYDSAPNPLGDLAPGEYALRIGIPPRTLGVGTYLLHLDFESGVAGWAVERIHRPGTICTFHLDDLTSRRGNFRQGYLSTMMDWTVERS